LLEDEIFWLLTWLIHSQKNSSKLSSATTSQVQDPTMRSYTLRGSPRVVVDAGPGTGSVPATVVGFQARPVDPGAPPNDSSVYVWNGTEWVNAGLPSVLALNLPVYANNAAAVSGGLVAGNLYRTGGNPDTVCVVH
jgi:hypothetical protein